MTKQNCIGIDLGTTYSLMAIINAAGEPDILTNADGEKLTASAVFNDPSGNILIGTDALKQRPSYPDRVAAEFKRDMDKPDWRASLGGGRTFSAIELSALVLRKLKQDGEMQVGPIEAAVITVPAYFDDARRRATIEAGKAAGLEVLQLLNEPTAAALTYARSGGRPGTHLIFDLGGGTFDVSVIRVTSEDEMQVLACTGNSRLGGMDFDWALALHVNEVFRRKEGRDAVPGLFELTAEQRRRREDVLGLLPGSSPKVDRAAAFRLIMDAEQAKKTLSKLPTTRIEAGSGAARVAIDVSQQDFDKVIAEFVASAQLLVETALEDAKLQPSAIDTIILVGGSTRIPAFKRMLRGLFGKEPISPVHQDEAVARGAAIQAAIILSGSGRAKLPAVVATAMDGITVKDVCSHAFGTLAIALDGQLRNDILIPKNTPLPASVAKRYFTAAFGQTAVDCSVTEVSDDSVTDPEWVTTRHEAILELPPGRPAGCPIDIHYEYDVNQVMRCAFVDAESGRRRDLTIDIRQGKTPGPASYDGLDDLNIL